MKPYRYLLLLVCSGFLLITPIPSNAFTFNADTLSKNDTIVLDTDQIKSVQVECNKWAMQSTVDRRGPKAMNSLREFKAFFDYCHTKPKVGFDKYTLLYLPTIAAYGVRSYTRTVKIIGDTVIYNVIIKYPFGRNSNVCPLPIYDDNIVEIPNIGDGKVVKFKVTESYKE